MKRPLSSIRPIGPFAQFRRQDDIRREALPVVREIKSRIEDGEQEGRISERELGTVSWEARPVGVRFEHGFSEIAVERSFRFEPRTSQSSPANATSSEDLGGEPGRFATLMSEAFDVRWEFAELEAASIGTAGQLTGFEFVYEGLTIQSKVVDSDIDEALQRI